MAPFQIPSCVGSFEPKAPQEASENQTPAEQVITLNSLVS